MDPSNVTSVHVQNTELVIAVPVDAMASNSARPSAGKMLGVKLDVTFSNFLWFLLTILNETSLFEVED